MIFLESYERLHHKHHSTYLFSAFFILRFTYNHHLFSSNTYISIAVPILKYEYLRQSFLTYIFSVYLHPNSKMSNPYSLSNESIIKRVVNFIINICICLKTKNNIKYISFTLETL